MSLSIRSLVMITVASAALSSLAQSAHALGENPTPPHAGGVGTPVRRLPPPVAQPPVVSHPPVMSPGAHSGLPPSMPPAGHAPMAPMPPVAYTPPAMNQPTTHTPPAMNQPSTHTPPPATVPPIAHNPVPGTVPHVGTLPGVQPQPGTLPGAQPHPGTLPPAVHAGPVAPAPGAGPRVTAPAPTIHAGSFGAQGVPTAPNVAHVSPMAVGRFTPGTVISRGPNVQIQYGQGGNATMVHHLYGGGTVIHYNQDVTAYGFHRVYPGYSITDRYYYRSIWGGYSYIYYRPTYAFDSYYYGWCHNEWAYGEFGYGYRWNVWYAAPWYRTYGYYFTVYPEYRSPAYWLTDWYFGAILSDYYAIRSENIEVARESAYAIDYATKERIRAEIEEIMYGHANQYNGLSSVYQLLSERPNYLYIASEYTPVSDSNGYSCAISHGDILEAYYSSYTGDRIIPMRVIGSKAGSCYPGSVIYVDVSQLQEFQNDFQARVELGMRAMGNAFYPTYRVTRF